MKLVIKSFRTDYDDRKSEVDRVKIVVTNGKCSHSLFLQKDGCIAIYDQSSPQFEGFSPKFARRLARELVKLADEAEGLR